MPRAAKPARTTKGANTKKEIQTRITVEDKLAKDKMVSVPPTDWTPQRKAIFQWLYEQLEPTGVLCGLDKPTFFQACVIIDRLNELDKMIDSVGVADKELRICRSDYFKQYLNICSELCLSPAARAKMGSLVANMQNKEEDPLLSALGGDAKC